MTAKNLTFNLVIFTISLLFLCAFNYAVAVASADPVAGTATHHYRHIMFRETPYAPYRGIHPIKSSLASNVAHYAFSQDSHGRITEIRYQIGDQLIRGNEVWDSFIWLAPVVRIDYQSNQEVHTYYDLEDQQIEAHGEVFRAVYSLDDTGRRTALHFYNRAGEPSQSQWNIHRYEWQHKNGKIYEKRFDLNEQQQPMRPELSFFEVELEYDRDGKLAFMRNLGLTGEPTNNESGAGIDRVTYDHNGNFVRWQVYDKDGKPVEGNRPMVHLGEHLYDQYGNKVGLRGYDRFGQRIPFSWGVFEHKSAYNAQGNQTNHMFLSQDGAILRHLQIEYTPQHNQIAWLRSLDPSEQLVASPMLGGAAAMQYRYLDDGTIDRQGYNADMSPFVRADSPPGQ